MRGSITISARTCARGAILAAMLAASAAGGAAAQDAKATVVKLATATLNDAQHEWLKRFAAAIEKNSNGRLKGEVFPASQLGAIPRMIEGTQLGSIQIFISPPEFFVGVDQRFELLSAAGLAADERHAVRIVSDPQFAKAFLAVGANKGLIGVGLFAAGSDTLTFEKVPAETMPVHVHLLVECGIHIIECLNLEELAAARVRSFVFVAAPLKIRGATGAPLQPLALV